MITNTAPINNIKPRTREERVIITQLTQGSVEEQRSNREDENKSKR